MATQNITFITWNVNGLKRNRDQKFQKLQNADVVFLQETHIGVGDENIIENYKNEWNIFHTKYTSSSKGTAILVRKRPDFEHISDETDHFGAYVVLKCKLGGQLYTLVSVYNHHTDTKTLEKLSRYLQSMTIGLLVIGGDFNMVHNRFIDKKIINFTTSTNSKLLLLVEKFMKSLQLVDVWRRKNPIKQDYTYYIKKDCPVSRLDYFFVPEECMWCVRSCEIKDSEINENKDHQPVSLETNVPVLPIQQNSHIQTVFQWLNLKKDLLTDKMGTSLVEESSHAVSEVDIVSAVNSLQVSDTPRPDGIPVSFYKDNIHDLIPYIKMLYDRIHRGAFNCSEKHFNETVKSPHDNNQHFFNVDYLTIATILARSLEDVIESLPKGQIPIDSATLMIIPKTHYALISLSHVKDELEQQKRSNPTLSQDLIIIENLLGDAKQDFSVEKYKVLHQTCPLTPGLITLALKSYGSQLFGHLENFGVFIFKQSVLVYFQREDLDKVKATVEDGTNELCEMEILSRGNCDLLQLNCLGNDCKDEDCDECDMETSLINEDQSTESSYQADERDDGIENKSKIYDEDESMDVDVRSAITRASEEEMKKNTPPLLPVPSPSRTYSHGTKRKRDLESSDSSIETPLTTDMIMEKARQILKSVTKSSDEIDKGSRKKAIIGIFGKSGEGKSSLLSAILGKKDLLPSGCFGACTAVVTQVEANLTDSNYTAEIELISKEEWEKELEELFRDINDESEARNEDLIEIALEKITALYGVDADQKTLEELKNDEKFVEIQTFLSVSKKIISSSNLSEFTNEVASYIQHSESSSGDWYWPLVKSVTIKIPNCCDLMEHIVLLDLPGTGDCNKIRDDLWKSKLRECSSVWIVSAINRAITDRDPWGILKHCIEELGPGGKCKSINFICTKTDDINPGAYIRSARLSRDQIPDDKDQKKPCIRHRNNHAKTKVKDKFENSEIKNIFNTENQFRVFTVSSNAFFDRDLNLDSSETEIPKLQDDLMTLNKSINRELTRDYVNKAKGDLYLIQSGQYDKDKKMIEMKVNIIKEFEMNLKESLIVLDKYFESVYKELEQHLSKGVEESVKSCVASTRNLIAPNKDGRGFHKILGAFCRNYGFYCSKNRDVVLDLNKTLAQHLHISNYFCQIFPVSGKTGKSVQEQIDKFSIIQSDSTYSSSDILHYIHNYITIEETKLKAALNRDIVDMKTDIHSSIQITIENEMASCYQQAAAVRGTGSMKIKQDMLITTVDNIKEDMFNKAKKEMLKKFTNLKLGVLNYLKTELQEVIKHSQTQTSKKTQMDVFREIVELEGLLEQLSE